MGVGGEPTSPHRLGLSPPPPNKTKLHVTPQLFQSQGSQHDRPGFKPQSPTYMVWAGCDVATDQPHAAGKDVRHSASRCADVSSPMIDSHKAVTSHELELRTPRMPREACSFWKPDFFFFFFLALLRPCRSAKCNTLTASGIKRPQVADHRVSFQAPTGVALRRVELRCYIATGHISAPFWCRLDLRRSPGSMLLPDTKTNCSIRWPEAGSVVYLTRCLDVPGRYLFASRASIIRQPESVTQAVGNFHAARWFLGSYKPTGVVKKVRCHGSTESSVYEEKLYRGSRASIMTISGEGKLKHEVEAIHDGTFSTTD